MTNNAMKVYIGRSLMLVILLLVSACDGGIFGTGGPDNINMNTMDAGAPTTDGQVGSTAGASVSGTEGDTNSTANSVEQGTADAGSTGNAAGTTDAGNTDGFTDGTTTTEGITDGGGTDSGQGSDTPVMGSNQFTNNQATLDTADIRLNLINTASIPVNANESAVANAPLLFGDNGVQLNMLSNTATLQRNNTSINIVDHNTRAEIVFSFANVTVLDATFTTLLVRENGGQIDAIPLTTLTKTSDPMLAKVRIVQADVLGNASAEAMFQLQSAGANPGGIDERFGPLSFVAPISNYTDIPNGDYELIDELGRIENQALTFVGGNVYSIIVLGNGTNPILLVNDTQSGG